MRSCWNKIQKQHQTTHVHCNLSTLCTKLCTLCIQKVYSLELNFTACDTAPCGETCWNPTGVRKWSCWMKWMMTMHPQTSPALKISWKKRPICSRKHRFGPFHGKKMPATVGVGFPTICWSLSLCCAFPNAIWHVLTCFDMFWHVLCRSPLSKPLWKTAPRRSRSSARWLKWPGSRRFGQSLCKDRLRYIEMINLRLIYCPLMNSPYLNLTEDFKGWVWWVHVFFSFVKPFVPVFWFQAASCCQAGRRAKIGKRGGMGRYR